MKEAFTKADNVLATAAKCITDVINSRGHIIVDFADVCTVMKNGGVAILGKAEVEGENRAQRAIEEALNSPLLNDNDIKGAKWLLLNINSAEGDFECSMDELEVINNILRERTGEHSDVIMGMGYDETLGEKIGITLIATGFEHKDPFKKEEPKKAEAPVEEKIVMTLMTEEPAKATPVVEATAGNQIQDEFEAPEVEDNHFVLDMEAEATPAVSFVVEEEALVEETQDTEETEETKDAEIEMEQEAPEEMASVTIAAAEMMEEMEIASIEMELAPTLVEEEAVYSSVFVEVPDQDEVSEVSLNEAPAFFELDMEVVNEAPAEFILSKPTNIYDVEAIHETIESTVDLDQEEMEETQEASLEEVNSIVFESNNEPFQVVEEAAPVVEMENGAEIDSFETSFRTITAASEEAYITPSQMVVAEDESEMQLVIREETVASNKPNHQHYDMPIDDSEEQRRKVAERIQKLRNLSFNINNGGDPNNEFDAVPAYVRRNLDLFGNTMASVENYYSKYTVEKDENDQTQISTINSFLDGKKPD
jgi:cell division protein FtsZ